MDAPGQGPREVMIIIPSIDLREGRVVRLQQGDYSRQLNYDVDPIETAKQPNGRLRHWVYIEEFRKYLRVVTLEDGETVHNAFFDRGYKRKQK